MPLSKQLKFVMAGGGTGGHVVPLIAVARELKKRGHDVLFIGTKAGFEAKLVPDSGFPIEWIEIGGLKRVGLARTIATALQLPSSVLRSMKLLDGAAAVFSMGGYVAGPVMVAAAMKRTPLIVMEPNAMPGLTNRWLGKPAHKVLLSFREAADHFRPEQVEFTGLPVRAEFFSIPAKQPGEELSVLITGGSRGSQKINAAVRNAWPQLKNMSIWIRHQTGSVEYDTIAKAFAESGVRGEVVPFIKDMPAAFAEADVVVCRSGAGAVAELAAAGKPSILIPFPFAADDHQLRNAEALAKPGAARLLLDKDLDADKLVSELRQMDPPALRAMSEAARAFAHPGAAERAASLLEEAARS